MARLGRRMGGRSGPGVADAPDTLALVSAFAARVHQRIRRLDTRVCLGMDPRPEAHPATHPDRHGGDPAAVARATVEYFRAILESTADAVACVKLQAAFFERLGIPGLIAMAQLLADARAMDIPAILDAKRGDVGSTAQAYADAYLGDGVFAADALTVSPYLGRDGIVPFAAAAAERGRGLFVLVKTSNSGSADLQDLPVHDDRQPVWRHAAELVAGLADEFADGAPHEYGPIGAVLGGTHRADLPTARGLLPRSLLLVPGYGAQGARAEDVVGAFATDGSGAVVSASRSLTYVSDGGDWAERARAAATSMRDAINAALDRRAAGR